MLIHELYESFKKSSGISIDSRTIKNNQIFFAIKGENFDGHTYVEQVVQDGAMLAVIDDPIYEIKGKTFLVSNVLISLQDLANHHRNQFDGPVLAITGSNGKTTTKELVDAVLQKKYNIHCTRGNYNNHLGVPITILEAGLQNDILIIEMGANHINEIEFLCKIAQPNLGLITNIGYAHIEGFGSFQGVIQAKTELYKYLQESNGQIIYNQDDQILTKNLPDGTQNYGYNVDDIEFLYNHATLGFIDLETDEKYFSQLFGLFNQANIEAAITIGRYFKVLDEDIFEAIEAYVPKMNRSQYLQKGTAQIIMDAYNANPTSMKLSIKSLMNVDARKKCLILGDMKELGEQEIQMHAEILSYIENESWDFVALVGDLFFKADPSLKFKHYKNINELVDDIGFVKSKIENTTLLLKGSRSMKLENLIAYLD